MAKYQVYTSAKVYGTWHIPTCSTMYYRNTQFQLNMNRVWYYVLDPFLSLHVGEVYTVQWKHKVRFRLALSLF